MAEAKGIDYAAIEGAVAKNKLWQDLERVNQERADIEAEYRGVLKTMQEPVLVEPEEQEGHIARLTEMLNRVRQVRDRQREIVKKLNEASTAEKLYETK